MDFYDKDLETIRYFQRVSGSSYPIGIHPDYQIYRDYDVTPPNWAAIIDPDGIIQYLGPPENFDAMTETIEMLLEEFNVPEQFTLKQNYPNPFNARTVIEFDIPETGAVALTLYDAAGKHVETLVYGEITAGSHRVEIDGSKWASGVYYYQIRYKNHHALKKMILVK